MARTRRNKIRHVWNADFYVKKQYKMWVVKRRGKDDVIGHFQSKDIAKSWLRYNWKAQLEKEIEEILLLE